MINIKDFDPSLINISKKSYKNTGICYIGCITIKRISDYENINSVNPLYVDDVDGYIEENNGNKYLTFAFTDKNKNKVLEKYAKLWDEIKYHIQTIKVDKSSGYKKDYMDIKFN